jgi:Lrp/AsnC family leucine-responsive transcriptional regulator
LSLTELARKLKTSKEVIHYRLNKLIDEKVILRLHTIPYTYRFGLTAYKIYLRLHDISRENLDSLIEYLMKDKDVFWIGISKGRWDIIFGIWAKNIEDFFIIQDKILERFSKYIQDKELSISRESLQYNRRWMYHDNSPVLEFNFGEKESKIDLDEEDRSILNELIRNSREKVIDIADKTKLSVDIVSYRIKKMEKQKIIRGYKCLWNVSKLGFTTCKAFVYFKNITEEKKKEFINYCKNIDNTINIVITFAPWDLEIMFETENYESYFKIMDNIKEKFNSIIKFYDSILITSEPKQVFGK